MKTKTTTYIEVDYDELDKVATKFLNEKGVKWQGSDERYECVPENEWNNDESHDYEIDGDIEEEEKEELLSGNLSWRTPDIMNWMAAEGVIPKGNYKIDVSW